MIPTFHSAFPTFVKNRGLNSDKIYRKGRPGPGCREIGAARVPGLPFPGRHRESINGTSAFQIEQGR